MNLWRVVISSESTTPLPASDQTLTLLNSWLIQEHTKRRRSDFELRLQCTLTCQSKWARLYAGLLVLIKLAWCWKVSQPFFVPGCKHILTWLDSRSAVHDPTLLASLFNPRGCLLVVTQTFTEVLTKRATYRLFEVLCGMSTVIIWQQPRNQTFFKIGSHFVEYGSYSFMLHPAQLWDSPTPAQIHGFYSLFCSELLQWVVFSTHLLSDHLGRWRMGGAFLPGTDGVFALTDGHWMGLT